MVSTSKEAVAQRLAESHYRIEPSICLIRRIISRAREADPSEPVKLLEVNQATTADGIHPVYFGPHTSLGVVFPTAIIEITPDEYQSLLREPTQLPHGWELGPELQRPVQAVAG
jgi:hypothetical protein